MPAHRASPGKILFRKGAVDDADRFGFARLAIVEIAAFEQRDPMVRKYPGETKFTIA